MSDIVLLGANHKTAPIELRECLALTKDETSAALEQLKNNERIKEILVLSTCNRIEVLMTAENHQNAVQTAKSFIAESKKLSLEQFEKALYVYNGDEAVRHIFRVAASLDSMVVGEPQILGQIKEAYREAIHRKTSGVILNRLLHKTFFVAKRVRTETGIGDRAVSISYAAVELARKIFGELDGKKVLLIGAGEMAELAIEHLIRNRVKNVFVANRTFERAVALSRRFNGRPLRFEEIESSLKDVDIIVSSTGAPGYVLTEKQVKKNMRPRKNKPIFFIDIAVPRDIDPTINDISNAYVYDIDNLKDVIDVNIEDRHKEAMKAERIIDEAVINFREWYESLDVVPTIVALRKKMDDIARAELKKTLGALHHLSEHDCHALQRMTDSLINKFLHDPTLFLKKNGFPENKSLYLDLTRKLFRLDNHCNENRED